jgi:hypothetical protein
MLERAITHRDDFIMAQALIFALDALRRLPGDQQPESNIDDMPSSRNFRSRLARWRSETPEDGCCLGRGMFDRGRQAFNVCELGRRWTRLVAPPFQKHCMRTGSTVGSDRSRRCGSTGRHDEAATVGGLTGLCSLAGHRRHQKCTRSALQLASMCSQGRYRPASLPRFWIDEPNASPPRRIAGTD